MKKFSLTFFLLFFSVAQSLSAETKVFPAVQKPAVGPHVGEKLVYRISYLGISVGQAEAMVQELTEIQGEEAYHIVVKVRSNPFLAFIYRVKDEHHSYISRKNLQSLQYEKKMKQGDYRAKLKVRFDPKNAKAIHEVGAHRGKEFSVPEGVQDSISCGYYFRTMEVGPNETHVIPVHSEGKNWEMKVESLEQKEMKIRKLGKFTALEVHPDVQFRGVIIKDGKVRGWMSLDERRIPLKLKVKVPVIGSVVAKLTEYVPGEAIA